MWTAEILEVTKNPDGMTVSVKHRITDGQNEVIVTEPRVSRVDKASLHRLAQDAADQKNREESQIAAIADLDTASLIGPVDLTPQVPEESKEQQDAKAFAALATKYQLTVKAVSLGLEKQEVADALLVDLKPLFDANKEDYLRLIAARI